jgi:molecular chaperone HscB
MPFDPFDLLGVPPRFDIEPAVLQRAYLVRSASLHPDAAGPEAEGSSAALNRARQVLEDPESRADALLLRLGGPAREAERGLPAGFLAEIMSVREELEQAIASGDQVTRDRFEQWAAQRRAGHIAATSAKFKALALSPGMAELAAIRRELNAWRYIERMLEQLRTANTGGV